MLNIFKFFGQSHAGLGHTDQTLFFPLQIQSINHSISNQSINLLIKVLLVTANNLLASLVAQLVKNPPAMQETT